MGLLWLGGQRGRVGQLGDEIGRESPDRAAEVAPDPPAILVLVQDVDDLSLGDRQLRGLLGGVGVEDLGGGEHLHFGLRDGLLGGERRVAIDGLKVVEGLGLGGRLGGAGRDVLLGEVEELGGQEDVGLSLIHISEPTRRS